MLPLSPQSGRQHGDSAAHAGKWFCLAAGPLGRRGALQSVHMPFSLCVCCCVDAGPHACQASAPPRSGTPRKGTRPALPDRAGWSLPVSWMVTHCHPPFLQSSRRGDGSEDRHPQPPQRREAGASRDPLAGPGCLESIEDRLRPFYSIPRQGVQQSAGTWGGAPTCGSAQNTGLEQHCSGRLLVETAALRVGGDAGDQRQPEPVSPPGPAAGRSSGLGFYLRVRRLSNACAHSGLLQGRRFLAPRPLHRLWNKEDERCT